jgi:C-terminal peptidase prc
MRKAYVFILVATVGWLSPGSAEAQVTIGSCSATGKNTQVRNIMSDIYFWYTQLPNLDPARYATPEAYLEAVRYRPLDEHFSYITSREANEAFFGESQYVGAGFSSTFRGEELRIAQVFPDSPASEAGLSRGDRIVSIGGRSVESLIATNQLDAALGAPEVGAALQLEATTRTGDTIMARMTKRVVTIPTVSLTQVYRANGRRVGYIFFRNFVTPSSAALDQAFTDLTTAGIDDLVLDLRYNGGGLVRVAQHLASLIGGARTNGQVLAEYFHNDKNAFRNEVLRFENPPNAARLDRLIVIATEGSASASELIINSLRPFIPVIVVGDRTYGKPVGQYQYTFCDKMFAPVSFSLRNANGEGDYFGGIPADCPAGDDVDHQLGDVAEASLREALTFAATGSCSSTATIQRVPRERRDRRATGWQSVVNAY